MRTGWIRNREPEWGDPNSFPPASGGAACSYQSGTWSLHYLVRREGGSVGLVRPRGWRFVSMIRGPLRLVNSESPARNRGNTGFLRGPDFKTWDELAEHNDCRREERSRRSSSRR